MGLETSKPTPNDSHTSESFPHTEVNVFKYMSQWGWSIVFHTATPSRNYSYETPLLAFYASVFSLSSLNLLMVKRLVGFCDSPGPPCC